jgi:hypothetical protein
MKNRRRFGRRKSDYLIRYALITSLLAHVIVAASWIAGCTADMGINSIVVSNPGSTFDTGGITGGGGENPGGGKEEKEEDDGPTLTGGGGLPGIMLQDAYDVVLDIDMPLTVPTLNSDGKPDTIGKKVVPTLTGAPADYTYLKWEITSGNNTVARLGVVEPGKQELSSICPTIIPLGAGTATVTVKNCNSTGVPGAFTASFTVVVEAVEEEGPVLSGGGAPSSEGTGSVVIQFWTNDTATLATNTGSATLSRGAGDTATITAVTAGYSDYQWSLNGTPLAGPAGTATSYPFDSTSRSNGTYNVGLRVKKGNEWYSTIIIITVTD